MPLIRHLPLIGGVLPETAEVQPTFSVLRYHCGAVTVYMYRHDVAHIIKAVTSHPQHAANRVVGTTAPSP